MELGKFSLSLAVTDIHASLAFYQNLGFALLDDHRDENWVILQNGETVIGLFQGMFEKNLLTFVPEDARTIQKQLKARGLKLDSEADESTTGPAYFTLTDPDGNPILFDQHDPDYKPTA
ncbi:MAG: VOC family protein [Chloroflexi bacterium]|nr:VOC family protein [Chloroflexota bacterium]